MAELISPTKLRHIRRDVDRHGNVRTYVRLGTRKVRLREEEGSPAFLKAYEAALANLRASLPAKMPTRSKAHEPGSFHALCAAYFSSREFTALDVGTRNNRRRALERICEKHAASPIALLTAPGVIRLRNKLSSLPGAANNRLKAIKALFSWGVESHGLATNPARDVKPLRYKVGGPHSWTPEERLQFEKRHPLGTKARLAYAILFYTACRREDAPRLGPQHLRSGRLRFTQAKNEHKAPIHIDAPIPPELPEAVTAVGDTHHPTFLVTAYGERFSTVGFGNKFREWCDEAGLTHCSAHGLRKAMAAELAEKGATAHQIGAITGHRTLSEIQRYTGAADRSRLADEAAAKRAKMIQLRTRAVLGE